MTACNLDQITIETLERMPSTARACSDALDWFTEQFPDGTTLKTAWHTLKNSDVPERHEWLIWFGCHWIPAEKAADFAMFAAGLAMEVAGITQFARNVTRENVQAARAAAHAAYAADAATHATHSAYAVDRAASYAVDRAAADRAAADAARAAARAATNVAAHAANVAAYTTRAADTARAVDSELSTWLEAVIFA